jgi:hypothetical protein
MQEKMEDNSERERKKKEIERGKSVRDREILVKSGKNVLKCSCDLVFREKTNDSLA